MYIRSRRLCTSCCFVGQVYCRCFGLFSRQPSSRWNCVFSCESCQSFGVLGQYSGTLSVEMGIVDHVKVSVEDQWDVWYKVIRKVCEEVFPERSFVWCIYGTYLEYLVFFSLRVSILPVWSCSVCNTSNFLCEFRRMPTPQETFVPGFQ